MGRVGKMGTVGVMGRKIIVFLFHSVRFDKRKKMCYNNLTKNQGDNKPDMSMLVESKEKLRAKILAMNIEELDLSVRSYNCLKRAGFDTVEQLCEATEEEIIAIRNLGRKASEEVFQKLLSLGLCPKKETRTIEAVTDENDNLEEYNIEDDEIIDWDNDFEVSETNGALTSNCYCDSTNCDFREVCSLDKTCCVKKYFDLILGTLTPREEQVIKLAYGIDCEKRKSFVEIGEKLSITRERVRQIEAKALRKLRHEKRRRFLEALFPIVFSTTKDTPYSILVKSIFGFNVSNKELLQIEVLHPLQEEYIKNAGFDEILK